jgi:hypothetical protein
VERKLVWTKNVPFHRLKLMLPCKTNSGLQHKIKSLIGLITSKYQKVFEKDESSPKDKNTAPKTTARRKTKVLL